MKNKNKNTFLEKRIKEADNHSLYIMKAFAKFWYVLFGWGLGVVFVFRYAIKGFVL